MFLEGRPRKRCTKQVELLKAKDAAKVIYAEMLLSVHAGETKAKPSSAKSLEIIANSLWIKNTTRITNGELHKDTVSKDKYVYERHIKPFFANTDVKKIDADLLDDFRTYLTNKDLKPGTQLADGSASVHTGEQKAENRCAEQNVSGNGLLALPRRSDWPR